MAARTRTVVGAAVLGLAVLAAIVLADLFGTVLFALTVAFVLSPVQRRFLARGWSRRRASIATATLASAAVVALLAPLAVVAYQRRDEVAAFLGSLPDTLDLAALGLDVTVTRAELVDALLAYLPPLAVTSRSSSRRRASSSPCSASSSSGCCSATSAPGPACWPPSPPTYVPFVEALDDRTRETLAAILALQVGTAVGAFLLALPFFWLVGYDYALVLAVAAGLLQFLPIVGPIVLLIVLAGTAVLGGNVQLAVVLLVGGGVILGWLPDVLVRPRLAAYTGTLPGSLYFVGFIGGLTSLGMIGIVAGPLVVALLVEGVDQLAAEMPHTEATPATGEAE